VFCWLLSLVAKVIFFSFLPNTTAFFDVLGFFPVDAATIFLLELAAAVTVTQFMAATGGKVVWTKWDHYWKSFQIFQMQIQRNIQAVYSFWWVD